MDRFRLLQVCNRTNQAHLWVCPWAPVSGRNAFDEWIIELKQPAKTMGGVEYFVDINFDRIEVAVCPVGSMQWVVFTRVVVKDIRRPQTEDYKNFIVYGAPKPPWLFTYDLSI